MTAPLSDTDLAEIGARDEAAGDGLSVPDDHLAQDRHLLLSEVHRLRAVIERLRQGRPVA